MFEVGFGGYRVLCEDGALPAIYGEYRRKATVVEEFALHASDGKVCFFAIGAGSNWPSLVVAQRYHPAEAGFHPGALVVPETAIAFLGAGERLLAYSLREPRRCWVDSADCGFWSWARHGDVVLGSCELELVAWSTAARRLWSAPVEPPWSYDVRGDEVELDVMGDSRGFPLLTGPGTAT